MHLALWDRPPADCLFHAAEALRLPVECRDAATCVRLLLEDQVDVALVPTTLAIACGKAVRVLPGAAVTAWTYPFARIVLRRGFGGRLDSVAYSERSAQEGLLTRIVLQEHYGRRPALVARPPAALRRATEDAILLTGPEEPGDHALGTIVDLGQEWFELAQYPMVWGLFITLPDKANLELVRSVRMLGRQVEALAAAWPQRPEFYAESLQLRFDDVVVASLTVIREYLYYYKVTNELCDLPLFEVEQGTGHVPEWATRSAGRTR